MSEHSIGVNVNEMNSDTRVSMNIVIAKGAMKSPTRVFITAKGKSTTTLVTALARTAMKTSLAPRRAASLGSPNSSSLLMIASRTTIELVTRIPTESPIAIRVEVFSV